MSKVKVKMRVQMIGPNEERQIGDIVEVSEGEAARLIAEGYAEPLPDTSNPLARITRDSKMRKQGAKRGGSRGRSRKAPKNDD